MSKVAITTTSFAEHDPKPLHLLKSAGFEVVLNPYGRKLKKEELVSVGKDAVGIVAGLEEYQSETFNQLQSLKVISRVGIGLDSIDLEAATKAKVKIFNTPDSVTAAVAELTVGLILNLVRNLSVMNASMKNKKWERKSGNLISQKNVGLIGFGRVGKKVATILSAFDCSIYFFDPHVNAAGPAKKCASLSELLKISDIVSLHCEPLPNHQPLLGTDEFKLMKKGSWLINTARGALVAENALIEALKSGILQGAALDVFSEEPYQGPLCELDNVILTPHIGSYSQESRIAMELEAVQNLLKGLGK